MPCREGGRDVAREGVSCREGERAGIAVREGVAVRKGRGGRKGEVVFQSNKKKDFVVFEHFPTSFGNRQPHCGRGSPSGPNGQGASSPGMP